MPETKSKPWNARYPWDRWLKPGRFRARRGRDYICSASSFLQAVRNEASKRGLHISVLELPGSFDIMVSETPLPTTPARS